MAEMCTQSWGQPDPRTQPRKPNPAKGRLLCNAHHVHSHHLPTPESAARQPTQPVGQQLLTWEGGTISSSESDSSLESSLLSTAGGAVAGAEVGAFFTFVGWGMELVFTAGRV